MWIVDVQKDLESWDSGILALFLLPFYGNPAATQLCPRLTLTLQGAWLSHLHLHPSCPMVEEPHLVEFSEILQFPPLGLQIGPILWSGPFPSVFWVFLALVSEIFFPSFFFSVLCFKQI